MSEESSGNKTLIGSMKTGKEKVFWISAANMAACISVVILHSNGTFLVISVRAVMVYIEFSGNILLLGGSGFLYDFRRNAIGLPEKVYNSSIFS